ncbi:hypothetical protein SUGI_0023460 [Cryptomeria japonica]|nr:hypothetical protein SUGI_0023460 [Cryptomeria japonica]
MDAISCSDLKSTRSELSVMEGCGNSKSKGSDRPLPKRGQVKAAIAASVIHKVSKVISAMGGFMMHLEKIKL